MKVKALIVDEPVLAAGFGACCAGAVYCGIWNDDYYGWLLLVLLACCCMKLKAVGWLPVDEARGC